MAQRVKDLVLSLLWCSGLGCHCGVGSILAQEFLHTMGMAKKNKAKQTNRKKKRQHFRWGGKQNNNPLSPKSTGTYEYVNIFFCMAKETLQM